MKNYVLMTEEEFESLPTVITQIFFPQYGTEYCQKYFQSKDFSFSKLIPIPDILRVEMGAIVEKALATHFTSYGICNGPFGNFQIAILKELGISIPHNLAKWFNQCTNGLDYDELHRLYKIGRQFYTNKVFTDHFCTRDFCEAFWGTPADVINCTCDICKKDQFSAGGTLIKEGGVYVTLTTLAAPPLAWLEVFQKCFPAIKFKISVDEKSDMECTHLKRMTLL